VCQIGEGTGQRLAIAPLDGTHTPTKLHVSCLGSIGGATMYGKFLLVLFSLFLLILSCVVHNAEGHVSKTLAKNCVDNLLPVSRHVALVHETTECDDRK